MRTNENYDWNVRFQEIHDQLDAFDPFGDVAKTDALLEELRVHELSSPYQHINIEQIDKANYEEWLLQPHTSECDCQECLIEFELYMGRETDHCYDCSGVDDYGNIPY
jgi:hypothetical protein